MQYAIFINNEHPKITTMIFHIFCSCCTLIYKGIKAIHKSISALNFNQLSSIGYSHNVWEISSTTIGYIWEVSDIRYNFCNFLTLFKVFNSSWFISKYHMFEGKTMTLKVVKIKHIKLKELIPVWDISSPEYNNFALACGAVVHNSMKAAKMPWQEVLKLRGKMANVINKTGAVNNSEVVGNILRVIGYDPRNSNRPARIGKVVILTDADDDGCVSGATKILTLDGRHPTIKQLSKEWNDNPIPFWVWSRDSKGRLIPALAEYPRITRRVNKMLRLHLDIGGFIDVTLDHELMLTRKIEHAFKRDGHWFIQAKYLACGDSLASTYIARITSSDPKLVARNHIIIRREVIHKECNVYCLTVPETGNFMIADNEGNGIGSSNSHIAVLLLTIFQQVMPSLLTDGKVYMIETPLFEATTSKGEVVAGNTLAEMEKLYGKLTKVNRMKGLAGCKASMLRRFAADPATRNLVRIAAPSSQEVDGLMALMGSDSTARKKLLHSKRGINDRAESRSQLRPRTNGRKGA